MTDMLLRFENTGLDKGPKAVGCGCRSWSLWRSSARTLRLFIWLWTLGYVVGDDSVGNRGTSTETTSGSFDSRNENTDKLTGYWETLRKSATMDPASATAAMGSMLQSFVETELAGSKIREHYSSLSFESKRSKPLEEQALIVAEKLTNQIYDYKQALDNMATGLLKMANEQATASNRREIVSCCNMNHDILRYDKMFRTKVTKYESCKTVPSMKKQNIFVPDYSFNKIFIENSARIPYVKWQYFISPEGVYVEYPGNIHNCDKSKSSQVQSAPKTPSGRKLWLIQNTKGDLRNHRIVFLLQLGPDATTSVIRSMRSTVLFLLKRLDESDEVGVVSSGIETPVVDFWCDEMVPITSWTRYQIMNYLSTLEKKYYTAHGNESTSEPYDDNKFTDEGIQKAIDMACTNYSSYAGSFPPTASTIIHLRTDVTKGQPQFRSLRVDCPIYIDTLVMAPLTSEKELKYRKTLQASAPKNVWKVEVWSTTQTDPEAYATKIAEKLNSRKEWWSLSDILSQFFPKPKERYPKGNEFSFPHWNPVSKETVVVAKKYVFHGGAPLGLAALEIPLSYFTQQVTHYVDENRYNGRNYAFLIDKQGRVLSHPALGRLGYPQESLSALQIDQLESHFTSLKHRILSHDRGCESVFRGSENIPVSYAWSAVLNSDYIVGLVFEGEDAGCASYRQDFTLKRGFLSAKSDIQHHLLLSGVQYCYKQPVSLREASLYIAPNAYRHPAELLEPDPMTSEFINDPVKMMEFLMDPSRDSLNHDVKLAVKDHISALAPVVPQWKFQYFTSPWSKYILRRFGSGGGGTFLLVFPGSAITQGYIPTSSPWFRLATRRSQPKKLPAEHQRLVYFSPPFVDFNTGVPVVTISKTVTATVNASGTPFNEIPVAVIGADLNIEFLQRILHDTLPSCASSSKNSSVRCLLLDDAGYVVYHPHLLNSLKTLRDIHVSQLEPSFVFDVLQHSQNGQAGPIEKKVCHKLSEASAVQGSLHRFYKLSAVPDPVFKTKHGDYMNSYTILAVPGTNLFLIMIEDSKPHSDAFCPCSTIGTLCLNCMRMDPTDCECPCECPREPGVCRTDDFASLPEDAVSCDYTPEVRPMIQDQIVNCTTSTAFVQTSEKEPRCGLDCVLRRYSCSQNLNVDECSGFLDCTWCDALLPTMSAAEARCMTYSECYNYSRLSPVQAAYEISEVRSDEYLFETMTNNSSPSDDVGTALLPAIAILVVFVTFLTLVFYCYRHRSLNLSTSQPDLHLLPLQDSPRCSIIPQAGSSRGDSDIEQNQELPVPNGVGRSGRRRHMRMFQPQLSPRASSIVTDSDNGYSTMTPNEDSEFGATSPFVPSEPFVKKMDPIQQIDTEPNIKAKFPARSEDWHDFHDSDSKERLRQTVVRKVVPVTVHMAPTV